MRIKRGPTYKKFGILRNERGVFGNWTSWLLGLDVISADEVPWCIKTNGWLPNLRVLIMNSLNIMYGRSYLSGDSGTLRENGL